MKCKCIQIFEEKTKRLKWYDIGGIKLAAFTAALLLAKYCKCLTSLDWYWYVVVFVLALISPLHSMYCDKHGKKKKFPITYKKHKKKK